MKRETIVLTVELEDVKDSFQLSAYSAGIGYRALPWCGHVTVKGNGVEVKMSGKQK